MNRREILARLAGGAAVGLAANPLSAQTDSLSERRTGGKMPLELEDFVPKSMLHVEEHIVERSKFPVVDVHTHWSFSTKSPDGSGLKFSATPEELLAVMDRRNIRTLINVTGGYDKGFLESHNQYDLAHPGRFITLTEPQWHRANKPGYAKMQADSVEREVSRGAKGLKVLKTLGLFLRNTDGTLVKVDDKRFDPMWEVCGAKKIPVFMHVGDPEAFFLPIDKTNERFEELNNHPDWSFHGKDFPSFMEIMEARNRMITRHPKTQFILLHWGNNAENLGLVAQWMEKFPNIYVELAARIGELGRAPRTTRKFIERYQDRCMFGTDAIPKGYNVPQQIFGDDLYKIYYRFLETQDEYFDYAPAAVPPQGRWRIYGLGLPDSILKKIYHGNIDRVMRLPA
ncbi:MAG: amidohydrolase family protein [Bryobacterales bacterium]|nr:amidohydrolase family protein [Bryobacterales bacterium]